MISIKLTRDEARLFQQTFFPFMIASAKTKALQAASGDLDQLSARILLSLLEEVELVFKRKLLTRSNKFSFSFTDACAIAFYVFLMKQPIADYHVYVLQLRQRVCNNIYKQLLQPIPAGDAMVYTHQ